MANLSLSISISQEYPSTTTVHLSCPQYVLWLLEVLLILAQQKVSLARFV